MSLKLTKKHQIVILSGPSGVGKTSVSKGLLSLDKNLHLSISMTTRKARKSERDGVDYFFKSEREFEEMIRMGELLEYTNIYDNLYGTPYKNIQDRINNGMSILFDIDCNGALEIKKKIKSTSIFLMPPNLDILAKRLEGRGQDSINVIEKRLKLAYEQMSFAKYYDHIVENDDLSDTISKIHKIIGSYIIDRRD